MFCLQLLTFCLIFVACDAQEHFTCLRTDDVFNPAIPQSSSNIQRGYRCKEGRKGEKGNPGTPDNSQFNLICGKCWFFSLLCFSSCWFDCQSLQTKDYKIGTLSFSAGRSAKKKENEKKKKQFEASSVCGRHVSRGQLDP